MDTWRNKMLGYSFRKRLINKTIFTTLLLLHVILVTGQTIITNTHVNIGTDLISGQSITGTTYEFGDRIYNYYLDTTSRTLTLQLRGLSKNGKYLNNKGVLTSFDLKSKNISWTRDLYYGNTSIEQYEEVLLMSVGYGSTTRVELTSGFDLWNSKVVVFATFPGLNVAFGYKYNSFTQKLSNKLSCIDLTSGEVRWERKIDNDYGLNQFLNLNDTAVLVSASGLHHLNLETGEGWDYDVVTGVKDYSKTVGLNVAGAVLGLLTGSFVYTTGHDLVSNLVSNIERDSLHIYFASKEYLACLSYDGNVKWRTKLPKETSHSSLLIDSTKVYLINRGEAEYNGKKCNYGEPYIAIFDKKTGQQVALSLFDLKKNPILSYITGNDSIDLVLKDRTIRYALINSDFQTVFYDVGQTGEFQYDVSKFFTYIKTDSIIQSLHVFDPQALYLMNNKGYVIKLNRKLELERTIDLSELYVCKGMQGFYTFLHHDNTIFVLNNAGKVVAELNIGKEIFIYQDKLYAVEANVLTEIPLNVLSNGISN